MPTAHNYPRYTACIGSLSFDMQKMIATSKEGQNVPLRPAVAKLLRVLFQHRGRTVTPMMLEFRGSDPKKNLLTMKVMIGELRRTLDDHTGDPEGGIKTVPKEGYSMVFNHQIIKRSDRWAL